MINDDGIVPLSSTRDTPGVLAIITMCQIPAVNQELPAVTLGIPSGGST